MHHSYVFRRHSELVNPEMQKKMNFKIIIRHIKSNHSFYKHIEVSAYIKFVLSLQTSCIVSLTWSNFNNSISKLVWNSKHYYYKIQSLTSKQNCKWKTDLVWVFFWDPCKQKTRFWWMSQGKIFMKISCNMNTSKYLHTTIKTFLTNIFHLIDFQLVYSFLF